MFGYIRPLKSELLVREYDGYKAVYCGLCHTLSKRCGAISRLTVNYDFTFLAMLIWSGRGSELVCRRCIASPIRKKQCCAENEALDIAADMSMVLFWHKLCDSVNDGGLGERLRAHTAKLFLSPAYRKARLSQQAFDEKVRLGLAGLGELEDSRCDSIDKTADKFAEILAAAAACVPESGRRQLELLLYHTGRIIYILDAVDDLKEDFENGGYNPLIYRFGLDSAVLTEEHKELLRITITHSLNNMAAAFQLMEESDWSGVIGNIIYKGIPAALKLVLSGEWGKPQKEH